MIESSQIKKGDKLRDDNPRRPGRILTVYQVGALAVFAEASTNGRRASIRLNNIFADGKPRRWGFSIVKEGVACPQE